MRCRLANVVVFQVGWWIAVLGAERGHSWVSSFAVSGLVALNIQLSANPPVTARISGIVALLGTLLDSILSAAGILLFVDNPFAPWLCPPWLIALWCLFATTLNNSLQMGGGTRWVGGPGRRSLWPAELQYRSGLGRDDSGSKSSRSPHCFGGAVGRAAASVRENSGAPRGTGVSPLKSFTNDRFHLHGKRCKISRRCGGIRKAAVA